ncbi:uncharacterized protein LOC144432566 [Glandiceps talaboti]
MQQSLDQQLLKAAETNNVGSVKRLVRLGASISATDKKGEYNVLQLAAKCGSTNVVEYLVSLQDCPLNAQSKSSGRTALHLASQYGHWFVVDSLLNAKCDINLRTKLFGRTALHWAAVSGQYTIVEQLLLAGCDVNNQDKSCAEKASEVAKLSGFPLSAVPALNIGNTALHLAAQLGHKSTVQALLTGGAKVNVTQASGRTALHLAAMGGHSDVMELLIKAGADLNQQTQRLQTPLHFAASGGHQSAAQILLDCGCNTQFKNRQNMRPIDLAQNKGHEEIVEIILESEKERDISQEPEHRKAIPREIHLRGPEVVKVYEKALEEGKMKVYRARVMFVGQQGVGKTSLARCLRGESFQFDEPSTNGIETDPSTCVIDVNNWKSKTSADDTGGMTEFKDTFKSSVVKEMLSALRKNIGQDAGGDAGQISEESSTEQASSAVSRQDDEMSSENVDVTTLTETSDVVGEDLPATEGSSPAYSAEETSPLSDLPEEIAELLEQLALEGALQEDDAESNEEPEITLSFWDFGGQSVFYTTHQVFLTNRAVYILVVDITKPLDSIVAPETRQGVYDVVEEQTKSTIKDYIHFWLNSIHAHASLSNYHYSQQEEPLSNISSDQSVPSSPAVIIVATHKDQLIQVKNSTQEAMIKNFLKDLRKFLGCHVTAAHEHVLPKIYVVDNSHKSRTGEEDPEMLSLKEQLSLVVRQQNWMGEERPIKWLRMEEKFKNLKEEGRKFIDLSVLEDVADNLGIKDKADMKIILQFYHDLGDIIYFNEPQLQDLVILDPQWLVDVFKSIITVKAYQDQDRQCRKYWDVLDSKGILDMRLVDSVWCKLGLLEYKDILLDIMQRFDLICACIEKTVSPSEEVSSASSCAEKSVSLGGGPCYCHGGISHVDKNTIHAAYCHDCGTSSCDAQNARPMVSEYFVPSLLKAEMDMESIIPPGSIPCPMPLYFHFKEGFLPNGLYHRLVTRCLREWKPCNTILYRDCVLFELDDDHDMVLSKFESEILINVIYNPIEGQTPDEDKPSPDLCSHVRQVVDQHLKDLISHWVPGLAFKVSFNCPCSVHTISAGCQMKQSHQSPFIEVSPEIITKGSAKCSVHHRVSTEHLRRWFALPGEQPTKSIPGNPEGRVGLFLHGKRVTHLQGKVTLQELKKYTIYGLLKAVPFTACSEMAKLLDFAHPLLADYRSLASELEYSNLEIDQFTIALQQGKRPTEALLRVASQSGATIKTVVVALINIKRHDVLQELLKGIKTDYHFEF